MTTLTQTWICGADRQWHGLGGKTIGPPPPAGKLRILGGSSKNFGTVDPPVNPGSYDYTAWPYGAVESYEPNAATSGVPAGTTLTVLNPSIGSLSGQTLTITANNVVIDKAYIPYYLVIRGNNCRITRSEIVGGTSWGGTESALVDHRYVSQTGLVVADCTLHPQVPNYYINAFIGHHATLDRNEGYHMVDFLGIYNNNAGTNPATGQAYKNDGDVLVRGNYVHDFCFFYPDPAHSDGTHNDFIQFHGGQRSQILGNSVNWFAAPASQFNASTQALAYQGALKFLGDAPTGFAGQGGTNATATANRGYGSGIFMQQIVSPIINNTIRGNWFHGTGGQIVFRVPGPNYIGQNIVDRTGKQYTASGSRYQIRTDSANLANTSGIYTNYFGDTGAFVYVNTGNIANGTTGIRLDS